MAIQNNPLNSLSYTNKDFRAIYPELLDLVKKLTYKWDPSISNESDPGVILLKLIYKNLDYELCEGFDINRYFRFY